ncbi:MAG: glycosyltransferase family 4 protein [Gemmatimonadota bacterium]|nr:glycosyltransferase family 4 protein [Gemmatimonadota bacterium]
MTAERGTIVFVTGADEWYGSDYVLYELVRSLEGTEFDALVLVPDDMSSDIGAEQRLSGRLRSVGVAVHSIPLTVLRRRYMHPVGMVSLFVRSPRITRRALSVIPRDRVVLVHSHTATVLTGAAIAAALKVPHVWHVSEIVERPAIVRRSLARRIVRSANVVIAVSQAVRRHLLETQPGAADRVEVIHNGLDSSRFFQSSAAHSARLSKLTVGMIGRVGTWKGQELFLSAARIVAREVPGTEFVMAGGVLDGNTASLDRLRDLAREYGIEENVKILDYCADTAALLATFAVFVQPSLRPDPLPTTVLEAMASSCPVVATNHGGAPEMVVDGVTGILTPPGNARAMAEAVVRLLRQPELGTEMGRRGRARIERDFTPEAFKEGYLRAYRSLAR